jgi:hypothetical protein
MNSLSPSGKKTAAHIDNMMERLGIDLGYRVVPRFGLLFSCALRNCASCTRRKACTEWLTNNHDLVFRPPQFCLNVDLLSELLCDPGIGRRPQSIRSPHVLPWPTRAAGQ